PLKDRPVSKPITPMGGHVTLLSCAMQYCRQRRWGPNAFPGGSPSALELLRHRPVGLAPILLLAQRVPLVVVALARGQSDLDLDPSVLEVQGQRDDGAPTALDLHGQLVQLGPVQQQLAAPAGRVV